MKVEQPDKHKISKNKLLKIFPIFYSQRICWNVTSCFLETRFVIWRIIAKR